jgi:hypothetical protein
MATVMSNKPSLVNELFMIGTGDNQRAGALWMAAQRQIIYYLYGAGQDCAISGATNPWNSSVTTQCNLVLPEI